MPRPPGGDVAATGRSTSQSIPVGPAAPRRAAPRAVREADDSVPSRAGPALLRRSPLGQRDAACATCHVQALAFTDGGRPEWARPVRNIPEARCPSSTSPTSHVDLGASLLFEPRRSGARPDARDIDPWSSDYRDTSDASTALRALTRYIGQFSKRRLQARAHPFTLVNVDRSVGASSDLISSETPFDRYQARDPGAMSESAMRGSGCPFRIEGPLHPLS